MKRVHAVAAMAVLAVLAGGGAGYASTAGPSAVKAERVKVLLNEFSLKPSVQQVKAGVVIFSVSNVGKVGHEFIVLRTQNPANKLPLASSGDVFERGRIARIEPFRKGTTETLRLNMKRGHYALLCNLPGHYQAGQFADFTVW